MSYQWEVRPRFRGRAIIALAHQSRKQYPEVSDYTTDDTTLPCYSLVETFEAMPNVLFLHC